jgi:uncharacterized membrane protein SpoIIM required for sporulation
MMAEWAEAWQPYVFFFAVLSVGTLVLSLLTVPFFVTRLPADYFTRPRRKQASRAWHPALRLTFLILKNLMGILLFLAGIVMLFLPGQGVLTMIMGLVLMDFPGKFRLERFLISRPRVLASINWIRTRRGVPPLIPAHPSEKRTSPDVRTA